MVVLLTTINSERIELNAEINIQLLLILLVGHSVLLNVKLLFQCMESILIQITAMIVIWELWLRISWMGNLGCKKEIIS